MLLLAVILFISAALFLVIGIVIYRGGTHLIHDYHQTNVKDSERPAYGKAVAIGIFAVSAALFGSGLLSLLRRGIAAVCIFLFGGLLVSVIIFVFVQHKYNRRH